MSKFTRRSIPGLLAAAAGHVSTALTAGPGIDPVYAAIRAAKEADLDHLAALPDEADAERRCWAAEAKLATPTHGGVTLRSPEDVDSYLNRLFLRPSIRAAFSKKLNASASPALLDLAAKFESPEKDLAEMREHDPLRERLHAEVGYYEAACEDLRQTTGLHKAEAHAGRCCHLSYAQLKAALATTPTTRAGAAALAAFGLSQADERGEDEFATLALQSVAAFLSRNV